MDPAGRAGHWSQMAMNPILESTALDAARRQDEAAFRHVVEPHRAGLLAHCYRMLGSAADAEDALQEALLRAWRGLPAFEGRSSLRSWLYRIATNVCLKLLERRPRRVLPLDYGPPGDPHTAPDAPREEIPWLDPYPDAAVVPALAALRTEDATLAMPPRPGWYRGRAAVADFIAAWPLQWPWERIPVGANGQPAFAVYERGGDRRAHAIEVLTVTAGGRIAGITAFHTPAAFARFGLPAERPLQEETS